MAEVAVEVPERVAGVVRDTIVLLFRATTEALHLSLAAGDQAGEVSEEVRFHRERLKGLDGLLDQLGWPGEAGRGDLASRGGSRKVVLTGPRELLRDALHGALIDAGERLAVACEASWREEASAASIRAAASEVIELDRLMRELERKGAD